MTDDTAVILQLRSHRRCPGEDCRDLPSRNGENTRPHSSVHADGGGKQAPKHVYDVPDVNSGRLI